MNGLAVGCGFGAAHDALSVVGKEVFAKEDGKYRGVCCGSVMQGDGAWYAEWEVLRRRGGNFCVGVAEEGFELSGLVGVNSGLGLHGSGSMAGGDWEDVCEEIGEGDVIGICVRREGEQTVVKFSVGGKVVKEVEFLDEGGLNLVGCLYRNGVQLRLRCCETEWEYRYENVMSVCGTKGRKTLKLVTSAVITP